MSRRFAAALVLIILCSFPSAMAEESEDAPYWDWLGVGPIFSYGGFYNPYYAYYPYYPVYSPPVVQPYVWPYFHYKPTYAQTWWVGEHRDLEKVLQRARAGSSIRVFSGGFWTAP